ncbi:MAG TPA: hypothetical protein VGF17_10270 [Phytomonospora sp.]
MRAELTVGSHPVRTFVFYLALGAVPLSLPYVCGIGMNSDYDDTPFAHPIAAAVYAALAVGLVVHVVRFQVRSGPLLEIGPDGVRVAHRRKHSPEKYAELPWEYIEGIELKGSGPFRTLWFTEAAGRGAAGGHSPTGRYGVQLWTADRREAEILAALAPYTEDGDDREGGDGDGP